MALSFCFSAMKKAPVYTTKATSRLGHPSAGPFLQPHLHWCGQCTARTPPLSSRSEHRCKEALHLDFFQAKKINIILFFHYILYLRKLSSPSHLVQSSPRITPTCLELVEQQLEDLWGRHRAVYPDIGDGAICRCEHRCLRGTTFISPP